MSILLGYMLMQTKNTGLIHRSRSLNTHQTPQLFVMCWHGDHSRKTLPARVWLVNSVTPCDTTSCCTEIVWGSTSEWGKVDQRKSKLFHTWTRWELQLGKHRVSRFCQRSSLRRHLRTEAESSHGHYHLPPFCYPKITKLSFWHHPTQMVIY